MADVTLESQEQLLDDNGVHIICPTLHHTGNQTARREEMLHWYYNVLGQRPTVEGHPPRPPQRATWTTNDWAHHRMGFFETHGIDPDAKPSTTTPGTQHVAWEYESVDSLLESWDRLEKLGIKPVFAVDHGPSIAFYYRDPDGNLVELLCDAFGDHERSLAMAQSEQVWNNPPGIPVDPRRMLEARRGGMSWEDLHERAYAGEFLPANEEDQRTGDYTD